MGAQLQPGQVFAGFRVHHRLGAGGMGDVYAADHPRLPRRVALKLLTADTTDRGAAARFEREAETIARLDHPNIVDVLDRGIEHGQPWISMQLVDGVDAAAVLRAEGPMSLPRVLRIGMQIAGALDAAHRRGVVHRDVKPANIMLARTDHGGERALITDFGIARWQQAPVLRPGAEGGTTMAAAADITGQLDGVRATAAYASPEQLSGEPTDGRSDQYSLACTLYALLTGHGPYPGTVARAIKGHLTDPVPSLEQVLPQVPQGVSAAMARAMSKDPARRFATCAEFVRALSADAVPPVHAGPTRSAPSPATGASTGRGRQGSRALTASVAASVAAVALAAGGYGIWHLTDGGTTVTGGGPTIGTSTTATTTTTSTTSVNAEDALWETGTPVLGLWPSLFPQTPTGKGYQGMVCTPNDERPSHRAVQNKYRFVCAARPDGINQPVITVDLVVYNPGDRDRAVAGAVGSVPPLPIPAHGTKLRTYHLTDPVAGAWILVTYTAADRNDYVIQVGTPKGELTYSELFDWIAAAPF